MSGRILGFIVWAAVGAALILAGVCTWFSRKPVGFWANAEMFEVSDVRGYNRAMAKLLWGFGTVFILLGLPLLAGQNSPWILLSVLGCMLEVIAAMAVYTLGIEKKYRKR